MGRPKKIIEPINASFEELTKAVVSPWHQDEERDNPNSKDCKPTTKNNKSSSRCKSSNRKNNKSLLS